MIGTARTNVAALREQLPPLEQRLAVLKAERNEKQTILNGATLDTPPLDVAIASTRIPLLDRAIAQLSDELAPLQARLQAAERTLADMESDVEVKLHWLEVFHYPDDQDVSSYAVSRWIETLQEVRGRVHDLIEAPLEEGMRYEPVITVTWEVMREGQQRPQRPQTAMDQAREAAIRGLLFAPVLPAQEDTTSHELPALGPYSIRRYNEIQDAAVAAVADNNQRRAATMRQPQGRFTALAQALAEHERGRS